MQAEHKSLAKAQINATGQVIAQFAVFNQPDKEGDVILPGAFTDGQPLMLASYGHKWNELPVGSGIIKVEPTRALFVGKFFDTATAQETYQTVKAMGDLQQWSFGFWIRESSRGTLHGQPVRFLKRLDVFEVSPVLVGAGSDTRTVAVKSLNDADRRKLQRIREKLVFDQVRATLQSMRSDVLE